VESQVTNVITYKSGEIGGIEPHRTVAISIL